MIIELWFLYLFPDSSLLAWHVQSISVFCWYFIIFYFWLLLLGSGVTELCCDIFKNHLSLLQNGQECVQWNWCHLQSDWTGWAQWWKETARGLSSDDWSQNSKNLILYNGIIIYSNFTGLFIKMCELRFSFNSNTDIYI